MLRNLSFQILKDNFEVIYLKKSLIFYNRKKISTLKEVIMFLLCSVYSLKDYIRKNQNYFNVMYLPIL